jgi:hypothetical protein
MQVWMPGSYQAQTKSEAGVTIEAMRSMIMILISATDVSTIARTMGYINKKRDRS